jgi:pimeloyl-ACP methyl ester carboxylesterase
VNGGRRLRQVLLVLLVLATAPVAFAVLIGQRPPDWVPQRLVTFGFDVRLATAPFAKKMISLSRGSVRDKRVHLVHPDRELQIVVGEVRLAGSLFGPAEEGENRPGVLLLHGSTPEGRRMGLYRIIASSLADRGYVVLTIDQRGFGQSSRPADPARPDAFDYEGDAVAALAYLSKLPGVDTTRLEVIGHSFGVGTALAAGLSRPKARRIAVLGPGPPGLEPPSDPPARPPAEEAPTAVAARSTGRNYMARRAYRYGSRQWSAGVRYVGQPKPLEALLAPETPRMPVLVVTDAFEPESTREALRAWQQVVPGETRLVVAERADHYLNTAGFGPAVIYDARAVGSVVDEIDAWFGRSAAGCSVAGACESPGAPLLQLLAAKVLSLLWFAAFLVLGVRRRPEGWSR